MAPGSLSRVVFIDWLRGFSILFMIETHVCNALLKPYFKQGGWFHLLNFFNGLVAPSFLFVSGWAFVVASGHKLEDLHRFGPTFWRQLRRIGLIWMLGYALHLPGFAYSTLRWVRNPSVWQGLLRVDILHCIAAGLLVVFAVRVLVKTERRFAIVLWLSFSIIVLATPWIWHSRGIEQLPDGVSGYCKEQGYSLFPLFPWMGFLMLGGAWAIAYGRAAETGREARFIQLTAILGSLLVAVGYAFARYEFPWPYGSSNVRAHPVFFALRAGYVFLWVWICWQLQRQPAIPSGGIMVLSRESLLVYVAHIVLLYHFPLGQASLARAYGKSLSPLECAGTTLALTLLMWAMASVWSWLKSGHKPVSQNLAYASGAVAAAIFLSR